MHHHRDTQEHIHHDDVCHHKGSEGVKILDLKKQNAILSLHTIYCCSGCTRMIYVGIVCLPLYWPGVRKFNFSPTKHRGTCCTGVNAVQEAIGNFLHLLQWGWIKKDDIDDCCTRNTFI